MEPFIDRLALAVQQRGNSVLVGLDPRYDQLPPALRSAAASDSAGQARAVGEFCRAVVDVVAPLVAAVKPQAAFFEQLGVPGMQALAEVIQHASARKLLVILDAKRNDIGSTAQAYADAYLGRGGSTWGADALTVSPYLGPDSLDPFVEVAQARGGGVFVLVKTSNPGGGRFQDLTSSGRPLYRHVAEVVEELATRTAGRCGYGAVGAVVGATYPKELAELRAAMPHAWFLIPGYGSQGATAQDVAAGFDCRGLGAIVNSSRAIIFAYEDCRFAHLGPQRWQEAIEAATRAMIQELKEVVPICRPTVA